MARHSPTENGASGGTFSDSLFRQSRGEDLVWVSEPVKRAHQDLVSQGGSPALYGEYSEQILIPTESVQEFNEPLPMESSPILSGPILHPELPIEGTPQSQVMVSASGMSSIRALGVFCTAPPIAPASSIRNRCGSCRSPLGDETHTGR